MIRHLYLSPGHNYRGHHGGPAGENPVLEVGSIECVAGRGIVGDRYFDHQPDFKGQITFFEWENLLRMWEELGVPEADRNPAATRRNVLVEGLDLNALIGREFEIQGVQFLGTEECKPCYWMNGAIHPQAEEWMKGRGGLRAKILRSGTLTVTGGSTPPRLASVLLVGGKSTRMGRDKAWVEIGGQPLWSRQLGLLGSLGGPVSVSSGQRPEWLPSEVEWVCDEAGAEGPLAGLISALAWAKAKSASHLLALAVDLPRMNEGVLRVLRSHCTAGRGAVVRVGDAFEPLAAVYPVEAESAFRAAARAGQWKLQSVIEGLWESGMVTLAPVEDASLFHNMNTPGDVP